MQIETRPGQKLDELLLAQVKLLNCVGMLYCGDECLFNLAKCYHSDLVTFCDVQWKKPTTVISYGLTHDLEEAARKWELWQKEESLRRTGYCIWVSTAHYRSSAAGMLITILQLLDCMWVFHFQMRPLLSLDDAGVPVPCQEVLWEANSEMDWQQLFSCSTGKGI